MKVAGQATLHAPVDRVWAALNDPAVLVATIPGCERLEATGQDTYAMTVSAGVAAIKGTYAGTVALSRQRPPSSFLMSASGAGAPGTVSADVQVTLSESDGTTTVSYDADAVIGGVIGGVGQRMLVGVAKKLAAEFFAAVDEALAGRAAPAAKAASAASASSVSSATRPADFGGPSETAGVFLRADAPERASMPGPFGVAAAGAVLGAAIALLGVLLGARVATRVGPLSRRLSGS
ncbi:carbon monoxide dehydrogenase subunit G [Jatrophihabitans telluris]|uniref:Carbon monoxide dehydrogenase subunit G n=1 Tax=Jatrophihabitans telluris TaxID=2038343 RepID=A0ABY4R2N0_9ACTN|nr:carbon monoxide dehydrogenase subunit G [Jatrophihabitans telluris]UQX90083.1 carbon monoxide dehydrogenase subunit G [Jatrophihabitans telluris]